MSYEPETWITPKRTAADKRFRFGCYNHSRKLSDSSLDLFAKVLKSVPESILVLKVKHSEPEERERIQKRLVERGIPEERLELFERSSDGEEHHLDVRENGRCVGSNSIRWCHYNSRSALDGGSRHLPSG